METRTQYRATCPACFKQHAISGTRMVDHGYTIPQNWHARQGSCGGVGHAHFGTPEGLEVTKAIKVAYERWLSDERVNLSRLQSGKVKEIRGVKSHAYKAPVETLNAADGTWFTDAIKRAVYQTESNIRGVSSDIETLGRRIAEWTPVAPVAVEVETGPIVHMFWERSRAKVLCAYSSRGFTHRHSTKVESEVTCSSCLKQLASIKEDADVKAQAEALVDEMVAKHGPAVRERFSKAGDAAVREIRYQRKDVDKKVRQRACQIIER